MRFKSLIIFGCCFVIANCGGGGSSTTSTPRAQTAGVDESNVVDSIDKMASGDIFYIDFDDNGDATVDFSSADIAAAFTLIVQSTTSASSNVRLTSSDISADMTVSFDNMLRAKENALSESGLDPAEPRGNLSISKNVGDTGSFRVLNSLSSSTSYTTVNATSKCEMDHIILYVDDELASGALTDADIETLCEQFEYAVAIDVSYFGEYSDINSDGHIAILITPAINRLGASGGGIITGYFYAADLYARTVSNPTSNEREIVYILAPDPSGIYGTPISKSFAMSNLLPAVVPHEVQHAISYNQHVFRNGGASESSWLNESLSHFAEDLTGFGIENPSRVELFLADTAMVSLVASGSPDLYERGAEYLFMRYLFERASDPHAFLAALENTSLTGQENLETAFGGADPGFDEWSEFMRRWAITLALTNTGISSTAEYQYNDRALNSTTDNWQGACLICNTEDNRGTVLSGPYMEDLTSGNLTISLAGTGTAFYNIASPPTTLTMDGSASAGLQGVLIRTE